MTTTEFLSSTTRYNQQPQNEFDHSELELLALGKRVSTLLSLKELEEADHKAMISEIYTRTCEEYESQNSTPPKTFQQLAGTIAVNTAVEYMQEQGLPKQYSVLFEPAA